MLDTDFERQSERKYQDFIHRTADIIGLLTDWLELSKDLECDTDDDAQWLAALREKTKKHIEHLT